PPIIYPGNIQGRNRKETGEKGVYLVQLSTDGATCHFHKTSVAVWEEAMLDAQGARSFHDILTLCRTVIETYREHHFGTILTIILKNMRLDDDRDAASVYTELLDILQEDENDGENFVWTVDVRVEEALIGNREQLRGKADFYNELFLTIDQYDHVEDTLAPLYHHQLARKHLASLPESEQRLLLEKAESLLLTLFAHQK
ncbi:MAG: DNA repair exonuclease, partial [Bacillota bacterium]|nr:DNA repair exonuclease [Bacillota bacterium]